MLEVVGSVRGDVPVHQGRDSAQILIPHLVPLRPELAGDPGCLRGIPHQDRVREEAQAARLVHDLLVVGGAELSLITEEESAGERVTLLAAVQLAVDTLTLENGAALEDVQDAAHHANLSTTRLYDRRGYDPKRAATFSANYPRPEKSE